MLKALRHVLYLSQQYKPGDMLPENNPEMVNAWLEAGSAMMEPVQEEQTETEDKTETEDQTTDEEPPVGNNSEGEELEEAAEENSVVKAVTVTAQAGQTGSATPSNGDDLAGRVPETGQRKKGK